jgi:hypothetical protein
MGRPRHVRIAQDEERADAEQDRRAGLEPAVAAQVHVRSEKQTDDQRIPSACFFGQHERGQRDQ